jgi:hypothetical protein
MVSREEVEACRHDLLQLRPIVQKVQQEYQAMARTRVALQTKIAHMVQVIQNKCSKTDIPLVEDCITIALQTETAAHYDTGTFPEPPPPIDPSCQPSGKQTASAEVAMSIYQQQITTLQLERTYREELLRIEQKMVQIYNHGITDVVTTVKEYSQSESIVNEIQKMASTS